MIDIQVTSNADIVLGYIGKKAKNVKAQVKDGMLKIGILAQKESRLNAPRLKGYLERSISMKAGDDYAMIYVASNSPAGAYAETRHEDNYNYGLLTVSKGPRAGNKYISRAIADNTQNFADILNNVIKFK